MSQAFSLDSTHIHLRPDESALAMEGGAKFWAGIEGRHDLGHGRLLDTPGEPSRSEARADLHRAVRRVASRHR